MKKATIEQVAAPPVATYDPNVPVWTVNTVRLELRQWAYSKTVTIDVKGNISGADVLESAIEQFSEEFEASMEAGEQLILTAPNGDTLAIDESSDSRRGRELVVSATIIDRQEKKS